MMISPESYYEIALKGKTPQEIMKEIRSLKKEINRLKRALEDPWLTGGGCAGNSNLPYPSDPH